MNEQRAKELGWKRAVWRTDDWFEKWNGRGVDGSWLKDIREPLTSDDRLDQLWDILTDHNKTERAKVLEAVQVLRATKDD